MADISTELARILSAIYGEDVRGSIHDAIEKINDVSEKVIDAGTAVASASSSSTGYYTDSLYVNTDTNDLWKCTGTDTWVLIGNLEGAQGETGNGIESIELTSTSGLVDTYTITYTDGTTSTFTVTNGEDGANGNKWYRGTGISGKAALPTVYSGSGVADANSGDMFLNPSEGAVYSCVTGGVPTVATWQYEMTLSGGGGGTSDYADLANKPQINGHTLSGDQTGADLGLANSSDIPTVDQTYNATSSNAQSGKAVASAISGKADTSLLKSTVGWTGKNKFDNHQDFFVGFIDVNSSKFVLQSNYYMGIIPVKPNTEYIITKQEGKTFRIALSTDKPANNVSFRYTEANHTGTEITVTTGANDNYLSVLFWSSANGDTGTYQQMADTIMARDASITDDTYEPYHPSVEQTLRDAEVIKGKNLCFKVLNVFPDNNDNVLRGGAYTSAVFYGKAGDVVVASATVKNRTTMVYMGDEEPSVGDTISSFVTPDANYYTLANTGYYVWYVANQITGNVQVEYGTISTEYEPYYIPLKDSKFDRAEQRVLGAKNLAPNIATTNTINNLTFTINDNKTISTSGTPSANTFLTVSSMNYGLKLEVGKKYKISGCPSGGSANTYKMDFRYDNNGTTTVVTEDVGNGAEFIYTQDMENASQPCLFIIRVASGTDMTGKTFKPMLRLASDPDDTYVPYAMTNRELTDVIATIPTVNDGQLTIQQNGTNKATFTANQSGNATANIVTDDWVATGTVSSGTVSFSGIDDSGNYGYKPFAEVTASSTNKNPTAQISTLSGTGTSSMSVTYTTDADNGTTVKLRRIK